MPDLLSQDAPSSIPHRATILAFDFGEKRIGVAVGESSLALAHPLTVIHAQANGPRFEAIAALIEEWQPTLLVVGMPYREDETGDGQQAPSALVVPASLSVSRPPHSHTQSPRSPHSPHSMPARCQRFANQLHGRFGLPVAFANERLSSQDAENRLRQSGHDSRSAKQHLDAVAAQVILQTYFETCTSHVDSKTS